MPFVNILKMSHRYRFVRFVQYLWTWQHGSPSPASALKQHIKYLYNIFAICWLNYNCREKKAKKTERKPSIWARIINWKFSARICLAQSYLNVFHVYRWLFLWIEQMTRHSLMQNDFAISQIQLEFAKTFKVNKNRCTLYIFIFIK